VTVNDVCNHAFRSAVSTKPTPCRQPSDRYLKAEMTENFQRSPFRDAGLELIAIAPAESTPMGQSSRDRRASVE
jgi:hypothetical protein